MSSPVVLIRALTGIGRATAFAFAREGARIVISGRRDEAGKTLATELRALGVEDEFIRADDEVRTLVDQTVKRFGRLEWLLTTPEPKANPGRLRSDLQKATRPPSIPTFSARC
jgi:NAD(P)-dependent dehydrogenase (short-subunit alcohol dehydrogenase family)